MEAKNAEGLNKKPLNSFELYLSLLGISGEKLPVINEMPESIVLPEDVVKILWDVAAITDSKRVEVGLNIFMNNGAIRHSKYSLGGRDSYGSFPNFFATPFAAVHTHPNTHIFSNADLAIFYSNPKEGYLYMVVSNTGISALARTQETAGLPLSSKIKELGELNYLGSKRWWGTNLENRGYVYYQWLNPLKTVFPDGSIARHSIEDNPTKGITVGKTEIKPSS